MFTGPNIVTDGLVLHLDAANTKSYPGSGTTWNDVSGNGNNGTLVNGPTFNTGSNGSIVFDGVNDYGLIQYGFSGYEGTFDFWFKTANTSSYLFISNKGTLTSIPNNSNGLAIFTPSYSTGSLQVYVNSSTGTAKTALNNVIPVNVRNNRWYNITVVVRYINSNTTLESYINGNLTTSQTRAGDYFDFFNLTPDSILAARVPNASYANIGLAAIKMYNRSLNATEILQNYNATKSRFNL